MVHVCIISISAGISMYSYVLAQIPLHPLHLKGTPVVVTLQVDLNSLRIGFAANIIIGLLNMYKL